MNSKIRLGVFTWRLPLGIAGGIFSSLAMPRENIWPLMFVSVAMILVSIRGLRFFLALAVGYPAALAFYLSQIEWMSLYLGPVPWIALSVLEAAIFAVGLAFIAVVWTHINRHYKGALRSLLAPVAVAILWTAREWFAINIPYGGFPWSRVAQALSESFLSQLVYFVGISGLSFVAVFMTVALLEALERGVPKLIESSIPIALTVMLILVAAVHTVPTNAENGEVTIAAVQGNANAGLFANADKGTFLRNHLEATSLLDANAQTDQVEVIVWPENASDLNPQTNPLAKAQIDAVVSKYQVPIILGAITESGSEIFNSSLYYGSDGRELDQYDKKRPVPFAEYVPDRDFWYQLAPDLIGLVSRGYAFGTRDGIFELGEKSLGVLICFEIAIDDIGRELVNSGAQIILSQTNNADFGRSDETFQQAALARLRAIETGRAVVNISTVGVSVIYLPNGQIVDQLPIYTPGVMIQTLPLRTAVTPAMRIGPVFDLSVNLLALALIVGTLAQNIRRKRMETAL